ncbi:hypothetical protein R6Q59_008772 [Mikania micrantha]|uniref:C2H2-type domain-containing protein n=1 Tax=Mikania micrantha TaxID=192012 RepID=A0A5N6LJG3_9ASTR|nr:hypothetical protein E3N88_41866 [Mikania micrantha]KAD7479984.1 hypothetical protein E3N88_03120 [Mikania micrantha]
MDPSIPQQTTTTVASQNDGGPGGPDDGPTSVVKGKRTKRLRPTIPSYSSSSYNALNSSPASYSDFPATSITAEDEDTANCLILLSKGHNVSVSPRNGNNIHEFSGYKFNSKRYIQTSTDAADGVAGIYVFECKTCSRTFPSFQALGGHRASHKKPRINEPDKSKVPLQAVSDEDEPSNQFQWKKNNSSSSSSLSLQLNTKKLSSSKLHECSICGAEFNSGQALGGHMRRHRAANGNTANISAAVTATNTTLSLIPYSRPVTVVMDDDHDGHKSRNVGLCLALDLNLPAPSETTVHVSDQDQRRESSFKFTTNQNKQQPSVHLSAVPTLVDCHY